MEFQMWIQSGVITVLFTLLMVILKVWISKMDGLEKLTQRIDKLCDQFQGLKQDAIAQQTEMKQVIVKNNEQDSRLNEHDGRLRKLESKR